MVSEVYQAPNHETRAFDGAKLGDHPMLVTGTSNNNMLAVKDPDASTGYRFFADIARTQPAGAPARPSWTPTRGPTR